MTGVQTCALPIYWLNVPPGAMVRPKSPLEYFRKLRFHQKATSIGDYGFSTDRANA